MCPSKHWKKDNMNKDFSIHSMNMWKNKTWKIIAQVIFLSLNGSYFNFWAL